MIVYNITLKVEHSIETPWLDWLQREQVPQIMHTGLFTDYKLFQLLEQDDSEGNTYILQLFASGLEQYYRYIKEFGPALQQKVIERWGKQFIGFHTIMQVVH